MITKITLEEATKIIDIREPLGKFYTIEKSSENKNIYVGIYNEYGDAFVEDFKTLASCRKWLSE